MVSPSVTPVTVASVTGQMMSCWLARMDVVPVPESLREETVKRSIPIALVGAIGTNRV